jgi:murein DD-endopeptidase MepM/ murein hydrolase activator NlpD
VIKARKSNAAGGGFGYYVVIRHYLDGEYYTSLYAHLEPNSFQVKVGQLVSAGDVLGKMGTSGMSTGKHLHFEIWKGKKHGWSADGKGFVEPVGFIKALNASADAKAFANKATPETDPVEPVANHQPTKKAAKSVTKSVATKIEKPKTHKVVSGDTLGKIARRYRTNIATLVKLNRIKSADLIFVGQTIRLP